MDGVIIDSEPSHFEAFRRTLEPLGINLSDNEYQQYFAGKPISKALSISLHTLSAHWA